MKRVREPNHSSITFVNVRASVYVCARIVMSRRKRVRAYATLCAMWLLRR